MSFIIVLKMWIDCIVLMNAFSEKAVFRPSDEAVFTTLGVNTHLFACEPSELESLVSNGLIDSIVCCFKGKCS